ncbi:MAG: hypothetical protein JWR37_188 [Mycobacterium sp.]|nr:hypothetical protein [Mycobacterium sp.]
MKTSDKVWVAIVCIVLGHNLTAKEELLSEAVDRYLVAHPWLTRGVVAAVALHLCNAVPNTFDPLSWAFLLARRYSLATRQS